MNSKRNAIAVVFAAVLALASVPEVRAQSGSGATSVPLYYYSYPLSGYLGSIGPNSTGAAWLARKTMFDLLDIAMETQSLSTNPLFDPQLGPFISLFHHARVWHGVTKVGTQLGPTVGVRFQKWYSSGWTMQFRQPNGRNFTVGVDIADGPFLPTAYTPWLVPVEPAQISALAANLDAYFITHSHIDHVSPYLVQEMLLRGKPVIAPMEMKVQALLAGFALAENMVCPTDSAPIQIGPLTFRTWNGWQYGAFLDPPANTMPDTNHPFNVEDNCYLFNLNGVTVAHFGDNNDSGVLNFANQMVAEGWTPDVCLNLGGLHNQLVPIFSAQLKFLTHDLEFLHFGPNFLELNEAPNGPNLQRRVLLWGEHVDFAP